MLAESAEQRSEEERSMQNGNMKDLASPWKHKAKVLLAFVALCLAAAFSGAGFA
jgi:hypothetical protein